MIMTVFFLTMLLLPANAQTPREKWISVADKLAATDAASYPFDWGEGVQMSGLMQVYGRTKTEKYANFVGQWAATHVPKGSEVLMNNHAEAKGWKGYCGRWVSGTALLYLHEARKDPQYLKVASEIAGFVRAGATRGPEGALAH
jgi:rhamnogalacturonyl hydrolase YesR